MYTPGGMFDERAAAEMADRESDVVADNGAEHRHPGRRHAKVFEQHEPADRQ